jgi:hypothetical protein
MRAYVRLYPFSRARYELYLGMYRAGQARDRAAHRYWTRALRSADDAGLLLDGARIRLLLANRLPEDSSARAEQLREARRTLHELGLSSRLSAFERFAGLEGE